MNKEIIENILSGDAQRKALAVTALKEMLSARATSLKADAQKFVTKKIFESAYDSKNGPFKAGTEVTDAEKGIFGTFHPDENNSGHAQVYSKDGVKYAYGPEDIKRLTKNQPEMSQIIDLITGKKE